MESDNKIDGSNFRFLIIYLVNEFQDITRKGMDMICKELNIKYNVKKENIFLYAISEIFEFVYTSYHLITAAIHENKPYDAVICIGGIEFDVLGNIQIGGTCSHNSIYSLLLQNNEKTDTPIINGIFYYYRRDANDFSKTKLAKIAIEQAKVHSIKGFKMLYYLY